jgi:hypothetical protein
VVSLSEAPGDSPKHILEQEDAAGALIDHALCAGAPAPRERRRARHREMGRPRATGRIVAGERPTYEYATIATRS